MYYWILVSWGYLNGGMGSVAIVTREIEGGTCTYLEVSEGGGYMYILTGE